MSDDNWGKLIADMLPKSIDDIVRNKGCGMEILLATEERLMSLHEVLMPGPLTGRLDNWNAVEFQVIGQHVDIRIVGDTERGHRITSPVLGLDLDRGLVRTFSGSLYALGNRAEAPSQGQLLLICSYLNRRGLGPLLGLPPIFY